MNNFKGGGFNKGKKDFGGKPKFGGKRSGGNDRGGRSAEMFSATCSSCHKSCQVPFKPSGDKPVYCSECFGKREGNDTRGEHRREGRSERPDYTKLPRDQRPPRHVERSGGQSDSGLGEIKKQLSTIEARLNRILDIINPPTPPTKAADVKKVEKKAEKKPGKKAVAEKEVKPKAEKKEAPTVKKLVKTLAKQVGKKPSKKPAKKPVKAVAKKTKK